MRQSLEQLHAKYPWDSYNTKDDRYWRGILPLDEAVAAAGDLHLQDDPLTYLDDIQAADYSRSLAINQALLFLPPEVLVDELGEDIALWTSLASHSSHDNDGVNAVLRDKLGHSPEELETARLWLWRSEHLSSPKRVLAQYALMRSLRSGAVDTVDVPQLLQRSSKDGVTLSASRLGDYALQSISAQYNSYYGGGRVRGWNDDEDQKLGFTSWLDTPSGFALTYKGVPNAMAGLAMNGYDEVMLHQLQGVQARRINPAKSVYSPERLGKTVSSRGLMPIDWQQFMVGATEQIASHLSLPDVGIQAAENNVWTKPRLMDDTEPHLLIDKAIQAYDIPAQRLGYTQRADDSKRNWHKRVS